MSDVVIKSSEGSDLHELRTLVESVGGEVKNFNSDQKAKYEALQNSLNEYEEKNQILTKSLAEARKSQEELEEKYKAIESKLCQPNFGGQEGAKVEIKAFENFISKGFNGVDEVEKKYLRTDSFAEGGALLPQDLDAEIIKKITELSPVRSLAKVKQMGYKTKELPVRSTVVDAYWESEGESSVASNSTYGSEFIVAHKIMAKSIITREQLEDSGVNMAQEISNDVAEKFASVEGLAFVSGSGIQKPEGFMADSRVASINSGSASTISFDNFATLEGELKTGYKAVYGFNRRTLAVIRNLKDGNGAYIWRAGNLGAGIPNTINGSAYYEMPDMPDIGANAFPIIYGDFLRGYLIGDRVGISVIRDETTLAGADKVQFIFRKRVGGKVILPEAFVKLKVAA